MNIVCAMLGLNKTIVEFVFVDNMDLCMSGPAQCTPPAPAALQELVTNGKVYFSWPGSYHWFQKSASGIWLISNGKMTSVYTKNSTQAPDLVLAVYEQDQPLWIPRLELHRAQHTLGVWLAPNGI